MYSKPQKILASHVCQGPRSWRLGNIHVDDASALLRHVWQKDTHLIEYINDQDFHTWIDMEKLYFNPKTGYTGIGPLVGRTGESKPQVIEWLEMQQLIPCTSLHVDIMNVIKCLYLASTNSELYIW